MINNNGKAKDRHDIGNIKRFLEVWCASESFRELAAKDAYKAVEIYKLKSDPEEIRVLWDRQYAIEQDKKKIPPNPLVKKYTAFTNEKLRWRNWLKEQCEPNHPRFKEWRKREMARGAMQIGETLYNRLIYMPFCLEISKGCSVGCGFCGFNAPPLTGIYQYTRENAILWRDILNILKDLIGPAARWGTCYYATDPFDNPQYEKFCIDFSDIMGMFPQTTTALPVKNPVRTKKLLELSHSRGCKVDRFSILTLKILERVHQEFSPDDLYNVELILQNPEALSIISASGRFLKKIEKNPGAKKKELKKSLKLYGESKGDKNGREPELPGTISCLSGFLINMVDKSCRLISPCSADKRWPLGYIVYDDGTFTDAENFRNLLERMIRDNMPLSVKETQNIHFRRGLKYNKLPDGFEIADKYKKLLLRDKDKSEYMKNLGDFIDEGNKTAGEIALLSYYKYGIPEENTTALLDICLKSGVLNHEPVGPG